MQASPTLEWERSLLGGSVRRLAALDEVGRGAIAGPVSVGAILLTADCADAPAGVRDSKMLSPAARLRMEPQVRAWAGAAAVGEASAAEIDRHGIVAALGLAARRALALLRVPVDLVLLDGNHDYVTEAESESAALPAVPATPFAAQAPVRSPRPEVLTRVKGDRDCAAIAAASILAKVSRDALMLRLSEEYPRYEWSANKGYGTRTHMEAIARFGSSPHHRNSWNLPGAGGGPRSRPNGG